LSVPDEGYSRNVSCALKLDIYVFIGKKQCVPSGNLVFLHQ